MKYYVGIAIFLLFFSGTIFIRNCTGPDDEKKGKISHLEELTRIQKKLNQELQEFAQNLEVFKNASIEPDKIQTERYVVLEKKIEELITAQGEIKGSFGQLQIILDKAENRIKSLAKEINRNVSGAEQKYPSQKSITRYFLTFYSFNIAISILTMAGNILFCYKVLYSTLLYKRAAPIKGSLLYRHSQIYIFVSLLAASCGVILNFVPILFDYDYPWKYFQLNLIFIILCSLFYLAGFYLIFRNSYLILHEHNM